MTNTLYSMSSITEGVSGGWDATENEISCQMLENRGAQLNLGWEIITHRQRNGGARSSASKMHKLTCAGMARKGGYLGDQAFLAQDRLKGTVLNFKLDLILIHSFPLIFCSPTSLPTSDRNSPLFQLCKLKTLSSSLTPLFFSNSINELPFAYSALSTLASLQFLKYAEHTAASGPLH